MILREGKTEYLKSKFGIIPLPNESLYLLHGMIGTTFGIYFSGYRLSNLEVTASTHQKPLLLMNNKFINLFYE